MNTVLGFLFVAAALPVLLKLSYLAVCMIAASGGRKAHRAPTIGSQTFRFLFLIPAHNEEMVIGECVRSIRAQTYAPEALAVYVIADNCSDQTAVVAREAGATVVERSSAGIGGKAIALHHGLAQLRNQNVDFDFLVIVDADNVLDRRWASEVARALTDDDDGFQSLVETKNPNDSSLTFGNHLSFVFQNRIVQEGRAYMGLPALLCGTGMGFSKAFLGRAAFASQSLTEDRELSMRALAEGYRFRWINSALIYDEKPSKLSALYRQYGRWSSGAILEFQGYARLFIKSLMSGISIANIDILYHITGVISSFCYLAIFVLAIVCVFFEIYWPTAFAFGVFAATILLLMIGVYHFGQGIRDLSRLWTYILVRLVGWGSLIRALFRRDEKWVKTRHTRRVSIDELEQTHPPQR
ncbi:MAG: glycosyltransferase [Defluviicoccus sp.]